MSKDPFEASADMRLLSWQRAALGIEEPSVNRWTSDTSLEMAGALVEDGTPALAGAAITMMTSASPVKGLIPGALVTLSIALHNEGTARVAELAVVAPIPGSAMLRAGTLTVDQAARGEHEAEALTGAGLRLRGLDPGQRATIAFKIEVRAGTEPLVFAPSVRAPGASIVAGRPTLVLERAHGPAGAFGRAVSASLNAPEGGAERPFYELDDEEALTYEAAGAAMAAPEKPVLRPEFRIPEMTVPAPEPAPAQPPAAPAAPAKRRAKAKARKTRTEPAKPPQPAPLGEGVAMAGSIDRSTLALVGRLIGGKGLGLLPHYVFANALACRTPAAGALDLAGYFSAENARLQRALVQRRLNRPLDPAEFGADIPSISALRGSARAVLAGEIPLPARALSLYTILTGADLDFLERTAGPLDATSFLRARQYCIGLLPHAVASGPGAPAESAQHAAATALHDYAAVLKGHVSRLFVRIKLAPQTSLLGDDDAEADAAARRLVGALEPLLPQ